MSLLASLVRNVKKKKKISHTYPPLVIMMRRTSPLIDCMVTLDVVLFVLATIVTPVLHTVAYRSYSRCPDSP